jgi:signal peptidase I
MPTSSVGVGLLLLLPIAHATLLQRLGAAYRRAPATAVELTGSLGAALLLKAVALDAMFIPTSSMEPTLAVGDFFLLDKFSLRLRPVYRGDIVCFNPPPALEPLTAGQRGVTYVKRVVAVAGDRVSVRRGQLVLNGRAQREPYLAAPTMSYGMGARVVPPGHVFVLGDNRDDSYDSREWGCLDERLVQGVALATYWPPSRVCGRAALRAGGVEHGWVRRLDARRLQLWRSYCATARGAHTWSSPVSRDVCLTSSRAR